MKVPNGAVVFGSGDCEPNSVIPAWLNLVAYAMTGKQHHIGKGESEGVELIAFLPAVLQWIKTGGGGLVLVPVENFTKGEST